MAIFERTEQSVTLGGHYETLFSLPLKEKDRRQVVNDATMVAYNLINKCKVRCSKARVEDRCLKYYDICCAKCHCVPSGTYGNKDECPCYRDLKNS
ncbi:peamaclein-like [Humulus lupulus]|uniref:peamaclein-like n=1 Tax=Humulus lupulus TaxID=3486 RepID=UPI002B410248|nr:peamaclein-like [Humulus lupulus]